MTKTEFKEKIQVENLICVHDGKVEKKYAEANEVYDEKGNWIVNKVNIFSCYYDDSTKEAVIFITDDERGIPEYSRIFDNVERAYDELYKKISRMERIYKSAKE